MFHDTVGMEMLYRGISCGFSVVVFSIATILFHTSTCVWGQPNSVGVSADGSLSPVTYLAGPFKNDVCGVMLDASMLLFSDGVRPVLQLWNVRSGEMMATLDCHHPIADMVLLQDRKRIAMISKFPPAVTICDISDHQRVRICASHPLADTPSQICTTRDGTALAITQMLSMQLQIIPLSEQGGFLTANSKTIPLPFPPKEILAITTNELLVADGLAGQLALVDSQQLQVVRSHQLAGHHILGLTLSSDQKAVLLTHQRLSRVARTSLEDIHWGMLMQNLVASVSIDSLRGDDRLEIKAIPLGRTRNGAADPAGLLPLVDSRWAIAISGTNQVAVVRPGSDSPQFIDVDTRPLQLLSVDENCFICLNDGSKTASVIRHQGTQLSIERTLGSPQHPETSIERGEHAFYSAKLAHDGWMTCNSCHVDGLSPDLLADTMGDGHFGSPKKIPSLIGVSNSGPWGWDGRKNSLTEQLLTTLQSTMRSGASQVEQLNLVADLERYLATLSMPLWHQQSQEADAASEHRTPLDKGSRVFAERCHGCHGLSEASSQPKTFDIGVEDETFQRLFNPPQLTGVKLRRAFFHDARYRSLEEVLQNHPDPALTAMDRDALLRWLERF